MKRAILIVCEAVLLASGVLQAEVTIETVHVGNPGNANDTHGDGYGGVAHEYNIGKYEVTNTQYATFLNAVADVGDANGLYNTNMGAGWHDIGGISRSGSGTGGDPWVYSPRANRGNRPVNYVSFWDACRFANWLHNGQSGGDTETGAYTLTTDGITNNTVIRNADWKRAVTSEDEWYKAAYYDPNKPGGAGCWDYPTAGDTAPTAELPVGIDLVNGSANYWDGDYVDTTYYTTEVGAYMAKPSDSAYGTFDQGGNVWEWNEAIIDGSYRGLRGGAFEFAGYDDGYDLSVNVRSYNDPTTESYNIGFRVSQVPEPATLSLLALGGLAMVRRRRRGMCK